MLKMKHSATRHQSQDTLTQIASCDDEETSVRLNCVLLYIQFLYLLLVLSVCKLLHSAIEIN